MRRFGLSVARATLCFLAAAAAPAVFADSGPSPVLRFSVQNPDGNFFPHGEVEFCLHGGGCLYADIDRGYPGQFTIPVDKLVPDGLYQVIVYDPDVDVVYEMRDWRYVPRDHDPGYDMLLGIDKFNVYARFKGLPGGALGFEIAATLNPAWEELARGGTGAAESEPPPDCPRLVGRVTVPFMFGAHFQDDPEAAGGVLEVDAGVGVALAWRSRYQSSPDPGPHWRRFHELTVAWDGNRYTTAEVMTPGRASDVTFHRLTLAYGLGRLSPEGRTQVSFSVVAGAGAVLDGTDVLRYLGRDYQMFGAGARLVIVREMAAGRGVKMGLCGMAEVLNWWATPVGTDHWHGAAPSLALGLAFY